MRVVYLMLEVAHHNYLKFSFIQTSYINDKFKLCSPTCLEGFNTVDILIHVVYLGRSSINVDLKTPFSSQLCHLCARDSVPCSEDTFVALHSPAPNTSFHYPHTMCIAFLCTKASE